MTAKRTEKLGKAPLPHPGRWPVLPPARSEIRLAPQTARFVPAKAVGSFVPTLTRKAFEKFGFSTAALITDWPGIAGADLARYTAPDRLKWPRGAARDDGDDLGGERRGATLVLRVDPARALDVEYRARQIIERINAYFGYRAVEALRLVQIPLLLPPCGGGREGGTPERQLSGFPPPLTPPHKGEGNPAAPETAADPLAAALARMEQGLRRDRATRRA